MEELDAIDWCRQRAGDPEDALKALLLHTGTGNFSAYAHRCTE
jgi:hypothetical protein